MKTKEEYEKNEYAVAKSIVDLFKIKKYQINPTINQFEKIDMKFIYANKKYAVEIKNRKEYRINGMMIEQTKLIEMVKLYKIGFKCRYMNYIEDKDQLVIYDLNSRFESLELMKVFENPYKLENYQQLYTNKGTASDISDEEKLKYVQYLYYNPFQTQDYYIDRFSYTLYCADLQNFVYNGVDKLKPHWDFYYKEINPNAKPDNYVIDIPHNYDEEKLNDEKYI